jgi:cystathionine beta-lyase
MFILCNPHNPTGRIFSDDNLRKMAKICLENNVVIVADEIHGDLIRQDKTFTPILKTADSNENIIMCTAINKTFNVAGLHASNIVIPSKTLRKAFKKELGMSMATPFTINAVISAYTECTDWLEQLKTYFDETLDYVMNFLTKNMLKVTFTRPEGTYIFWMDFNGYGISKEEIKKRIYEDANVVLESGPMFDPDLGDGFERICLSSPRPIVIEAFNRIQKAFSDLE